MRKQLSISLLLVTLLFLTVIYLKSPSSTNAAAATHVVISEIQVAGTGGADDEFIELYNPTNSAVDLTGWRLVRKNSSGSVQNNLVANITGSIPARGYFLVAKPTTYMGTTTPDLFYSASSSAITTNSTIILYSDAGTTIVDKVGLGQDASAATDFEGTPAPNPETGGSIERKANSASTAVSMITGADVLLGNAEDTDSNQADFVMRTTSQPQNSTSPTEPAGEVSPTVSPTITVTPTLTVTPSVTLTPTVTPSVTSSPTPTNSPTPTPTPTATVTITPTPSIKPPVSIVKFQLVCSAKVKTYRVLGMEFHFSYPICKLVKTPNE